jgi:hypothetical protein
MKLVLAVTLIRLVAGLTGEKKNDKNKTVNKGHDNKTEHPAAFAVR